MLFFSCKFIFLGKQSHREDRSAKLLCREVVVGAGAQILFEDEEVEDEATKEGTNS